MADHKCQSKKRNQMISITDICESIERINPDSIIVSGSHVILNCCMQQLFILYKIQERDYLYKYQLSCIHFESQNWINIIIPSNLYQLFEIVASQFIESFIKCVTLNKENIIILDANHQILLQITINYCKGRGEVISIKYLQAKVTMYDNDDDDDQKLKLHLVNLNVLHDDKNDKQLYGIGFNFESKRLHLLKFDEKLNKFTSCLNQKGHLFKYNPLMNMYSENYWCCSTLTYCCIDSDKSKTRLLHVLLWHDLFTMKLLIYNLKDMKLSKYIDIKNVPPIYSQQKLLFLTSTSLSHSYTITSSLDYTIRSKFKFFISRDEIIFFDLYSATINLFCISKQIWITNLNNDLLKELEIDYDHDLGLRFKVMVFNQNEGDKNKLCTGYTNYYEKKYKLVIPLVIKNIIMQFYIYQMIKLINNNNNKFEKNCFKVYSFNADLLYYPLLKKSS